MIKIEKDGAYGCPGDSRIRPIHLKAGNYDEKDLPSWLVRSLKPVEEEKVIKGKLLPQKSNKDSQNKAD